MGPKKSFQVVCAKHNQRVTFVIEGRSSEEVRSILNKQDYAIIEIQEIEQEKIKNSEEVFYFDAVLNGSIQTGRIIAEDIFQAYVKLVGDLGYEVKYIYPNSKATIEQKQLITGQMRQNYSLYLQQHNKDVVLESQRKKKEKQSLHLEKKIVEQQDNIQKIIIKADSLLDTQGRYIDPKFLTELVQFQKKLKQVKESTNLNKMQALAEEALLYIGDIEKDIINKKKIESSKEYLQETNELLKSVKSSQKIIADKDNIALKIKKALASLFVKKDEILKKSVSQIKGEKIKKDSFLYYQTLRELSIYKRKLSEISKQEFIQRIKHNKEERQRLLVKKRLIKHNIAILNNRLSKHTFSYTKTLQKMTDFFGGSVRVLDYFSNLFVYVVFLYLFILLIVYMFIGSDSFSLQPLLLVLLMSIFSLVLKSARLHFFVFLLFLIFYVFIVQFLLVNF